MSPHPPAARDRDEILAVYAADAGVHPYGIADVAQFWDTSTWWRRDRAVAGVIDLPGSPVPVVYAVSAHDDPATLTLLDDLDRGGSLPDRFVIHGPRGLTERLARTRRTLWHNDYLKMHLGSDVAPAPPGRADVRVLGHGDLTDLLRLYDTDPHAGDFFHAALLDTGHYLGLWRDDRLAATAGIHVIDHDHGVVALANVATHPDHRRRGLARAIVATQVDRLRRAVHTVGLNVREENVAGQALYAGLGFDTVARYVEAELARR